MLTAVAKDVADLCEIIEERIWINHELLGLPEGLTPRNCTRELLWYERDRMWAKDPVDSVEVIHGAVWALMPPQAR